MRLIIPLAVFIFAQQDIHEQYEEKRMQAPQNAKGQYELGRWCEQHKLKEEAIKAYERAIEIDPEFEPARKALGHKKVLGRWTSEKEYNDPSWWAHPKVDQKKVDEAILKGVQYLLKTPLPPIDHKTFKLRYDELVLLTILESGWDRNDKDVKALIARVLSLPLDKTYHVSLRAMCLAAMDPLKYQQELAQCAQFLVDNQCENGQWTYGEKVEKMPEPGMFPTTGSGKGPIPDIETRPEGGPPPPKNAPRPKQVEIKKGKPLGPAVGDNSNSQYAALGLRACLSGFVVVPKETIEKAEKQWEKTQKSDGGWSYNAAGPPDTSYGSMSAGAIGALAIYKYYRKRVWGENADWKNEPSVTKGIDWLSKNLNYTKNPNLGLPGPVRMAYYWAYATERVGRLLDTESFGTREWYPEGANYLLGKQLADGSWTREDWASDNSMRDKAIPGNISETCFAILFLRRATPRLSDTIHSGPAAKQ
jgi:tetratricopeptide (TPR) repeat protein